MGKARYRSEINTSFWGLVIPGGGYLYRGSVLGFVVSLLLTVGFSVSAYGIWWAMDGGVGAFIWATLFALAPWAGAMAMAHTDSYYGNRRYRAQQRDANSDRIAELEQQLASLRRQQGHKI